MTAKTDSLEPFCGLFSRLAYPPTFWLPNIRAKRIECERARTGRMPGAPNASGHARGEGRARQMRASAHGARARRSECERARTGRTPGAPNASGRARGEGRARQMRAGARGARARRSECERARAGRGSISPILTGFLCAPRSQHVCEGPRCKRRASRGAKKTDAERGAGMTAKTDPLKSCCGLLSRLARLPLSGCPTFASRFRPLRFCLRRIVASGARTHCLVRRIAAAGTRAPRLLQRTAAASTGIRRFTTRDGGRQNADPAQ